MNYKKASFLLFVLVQGLMLMLITKLDGYEYPTQHTPDEKSGFRYRSTNTPTP